jgi:hypothetical protein
MSGPGVTPHTLVGKVLKDQDLVEQHPNHENRVVSSPFWLYLSWVRLLMLPLGYGHRFIRGYAVVYVCY